MRVTAAGGGRASQCGWFLDLTVIERREISQCNAPWIFAPFRVHVGHFCSRMGEHKPKLITPSKIYCCRNRTPELQKSRFSKWNKIMLSAKWHFWPRVYVWLPHVSRLTNLAFVSCDRGRNRSLAIKTAFIYPSAFGEGVVHFRKKKENREK